MSAPSWVSVGPGFQDAPIRLFCFAHAGGGAQFYRPWRERLGPEVGVLAAVLPGRESRIRERPIDRFEELLPRVFAAVAPFADRPFAVFGHSLGALVGYEVARLFGDSPVGAPARLFVSGRRPPHLPGRLRPRHTMADGDLLGLLDGLGGTPSGLLTRPEVAELFLPSLRADFQLNETYRHRPQPVLACPVSALTGRADPEVDRAEMAQWAVVTSREFRMRTFAGGHFYLQGAPDPVVAAIREDLGLGAAPMAVQAAGTGGPA
jgi:surfactin synthase thioesterase subunit